MWILKLLGSLMVICCLGITGMKMALRLKKRKKTLENILLSIDKIAVYIRMSNADIAEILDNCLPKGIAFDGKGVISQNELCLLQEDKELLCDFFKELGMADIKAEIKKCASYKDLLSEQRQKALVDISEKYRLFSLCGWITGAIISLLWW